jgi:hypothetical protein
VCGLRRRFAIACQAPLTGNGKFSIGRMTASFGISERPAAAISAEFRQIL